MSTDGRTCKIIRLGLLKPDSFLSDPIRWTPSKHVTLARGVNWSLVLNDFSKLRKISCTGRRVPPGYPKQYQEGHCWKKAGTPATIMDWNALKRVNPQLRLPEQRHSQGAATRMQRPLVD